MRCYLYHRHFIYNKIHNDSFQKHRVQTTQHSNRCYKRYPERKALSRTGVKIEWQRIQLEKDCTKTERKLYFYFKRQSLDYLFKVFSIFRRAYDTRDDNNILHFSNKQNLWAVITSGSISSCAIFMII